MKNLNTNQTENKIFKHTLEVEFNYHIFGVKNDEREIIEFETEKELISQEEVTEYFNDLTKFDKLKEQIDADYITKISLLINGKYKDTLIVAVKNLHEEKDEIDDEILDICYNQAITFFESKNFTIDSKFLTLNMMYKSFINGINYNDLNN